MNITFKKEHLANQSNWKLIFSTIFAQTHFCIIQFASSYPLWASTQQEP